MPDNSYFDTHVEIKYLNKPFFIQLKRVWRKVKTFLEPDKKKKMGFFLQNIRGLEGSAQTNEKIVKDIFGTLQEMSPNEFIQKIFSFEIPMGKKIFIKHETAYQQTQRLVTGGGNEESRKTMTKLKKGEKVQEPLNRTIQISIFGDIYEEILKKYKDHPMGDNIIRAINRNLDGHFANAAAFVRWTQMTPRWIHVDAFQTDFFNKVKAMKFTAEKRNDEVSKEVSDDFRHYENEFFKAALSFIIRSHDTVNMYTANTPEMVTAVEHIQGDVKLKEYYYKLPKMLGFKLIGQEELEKKLHHEQEKNALEKKFKPALLKISTEVDSSEVDDSIRKLTETLKELQTTKKTKVIGSSEISNEEVDEAIRQSDIPDQIASAIHQFLEDLTNVANKKVKSSTGKTNISISAFLRGKRKFIIEFLSKSTGPGSKIWWADRRMLFENTKYNNRMILEHIRSMAGLE